MFAQDVDPGIWSIENRIGPGTQVTQHQFWIETGGIEQAIDSEAVKKSTELRGLGTLDLGIAMPQFRQQLVDASFRAAKAHGSHKIGQALLGMRPTYGVHFKFEIQQHAARVFEQFGQMLNENLDTLFAGRGGAKAATNLRLVPLHVFLENGEENVFLIAKMGIKSAARLTRSSRNVF